MCLGLFPIQLNCIIHKDTVGPTAKLHLQESITCNLPYFVVSSQCHFGKKTVPRRGGGVRDILTTVTG